MEVAEFVSKFQESLLDKSTFSVTWELVPGRGAFEKAQEVTFTSVEEAVKGGKVHALTITDNPGGNPAISAEMLGVEIQKMGIEPLVHFTCKDKNRNQLESLLYGMERANVRNLLIMTGDYTYSGFQGRAKPVFDLDPSQLLDMITSLNQGMEVPTFKGSTTLNPTHFFSGAAVSPFKGTESEQMGQYYKLKKKLESGAQFVVTQLGYDARKIHEVIMIMKHLGYEDVPVIGNIYLLPAGAARLMNRNGLPGCVVTKELLDTIVGEAQADDKGLSKRIERGAKMYAMMKGMGFSGVHIGGHGMKYSQVEEILEKGEEYVANWQDVLAEFSFPQSNGWYYFDKDTETGLNTANPVDRSQDRPAAGLGYSVFKTVHNMMFEQKGFLFAPMRALSNAIDGSALEHTFEKVEHFMKVMSNDCMNCGDCALFDIAYLCPMSQCPKCQRNGPCGGSFEGWCEVYPGKKECIYVRAYPRLKSHGKEDILGDYHIPPNNWDLAFTSSWLNFFCGRDHSAIRLGIEPPKKK
jgi:methylenetetrahydrofolate reductase (NADPH)